MVLMKALRRLSTLCPGRCRRRRVGAYDFHERLGSGGSGDVHRVTHRATGQEFACKEIKRTHLREVEKEAEILRSITGTRLQKFHDCITKKDKIFLITHYNRGIDLFDLFVDHGPYGEGDLRPLAQEMVESVCECAGNGLAHLDVKLENFVTKGDSVELIDFGSAHRLPDGAATKRLERLIGTTGYVPPEVYKGSFSATSDVWSLGVSLWVLTTGIPPFLQRLQRHISDAQGLERAYTFPTHDHYRRMRHMTAGLRDVFRGIFVQDPNKRMTLAELRSHPWLKR